MCHLLACQEVTFPSLPGAQASFVDLLQQNVVEVTAVPVLGLTHEHQQLPPLCSLGALGQHAEDPSGKQGQGSPRPGGF